MGVVWDGIGEGGRDSRGLKLREEGTSADGEPIFITVENLEAAIDEFPLEALVMSPSGNDRSASDSSPLDAFPSEKPGEQPHLLVAAAFIIIGLAGVMGINDAMSPAPGLLYTDANPGGPQLARADEPLRILESRPFLPNGRLMSPLLGFNMRPNMPTYSRGAQPAREPGAVQRITLPLIARVAEQALTSTFLPRPITPARPALAPMPITIAQSTIDALTGGNSEPVAPAISAAPPLSFTPLPTPSSGAPSSPSPTTLAASAPPPPVVAPNPETGAIQNVLGRYRNALSVLDADAAVAVWPTVNAKALGRAFAQLEEQELQFDKCNIDVTGARAIASCGGRTRYIPKVGSRTEQTEARNWTFNLRKVSESWLIDSVDSRQ